MTDYSSGFRPASAGVEDGRLDAPPFHRNHRPIIGVLARFLDGAGGHAIEIGSGTGQHVVAFAEAFPGITWWPSDPLPAHRASIDAWRRHSGLANVEAPVVIDAAADWRLGEDGMPPDRRITAIVAVNVLQVAPWRSAEGLLAAAGRYLEATGRLFIYGPFARHGAHTSPGNQAFDASLRATDPAWGVRDVADVAAAAGGRGLALMEIVEMPANNLTLVLGRRTEFTASQKP